jgi:hypothetical protein
MLRVTSWAHAETVGEHCSKKALKEVETDFPDLPLEKRMKLARAFTKSCQFDHEYDDPNAPNPTSDNPSSY